MDVTHSLLSVILRHDYAAYHGLLQGICRLLQGEAAALSHSPDTPTIALLHMLPDCMRRQSPA